jgi:hypothetical protein
MMPSRRPTSLLAALVVLVACGDDGAPLDPGPVDILDRLIALPGISAHEINPTQAPWRAFQLEISQPVNHADPQGPQFTQRAYLFHVDETMPIVFAPSGYSVSATLSEEMAVRLGVNCLRVSHRYYEGSAPDPLDWEYLTIEQSAADHHRIVELFKEVYTGTWLSAGSSKSGITSLFHRRFYPDDVKATVAYVSPFMFSTADPRFADFLETLGTQECRDDIHRFQRSVLEHADSMLPRFSAWHTANGHPHPADTVGAFEGAVASYDWIFWQYYEDDCRKIPGPEASYDEMLAHLHDIVNLERVSDGLAEYLRPYDYETLTQLGLPERRYDHLAGLLTRVPGSEGTAYFDSMGVTLTYSPEPVLDIYDWLRAHGDKIVYIYGGYDSWTGGAIELTGQADALKVVQPNGNHTVKIADLDDEQSVVTALEQWLGISIPGMAPLLVELARQEADLFVPRRSR